MYRYYFILVPRPGASLCYSCMYTTRAGGGDTSGSSRQCSRSYNRNTVRSSSAADTK